MPSSIVTSKSGVAAVNGAMHDHWRLFTTEGVVLGGLGLAAIVAPFIAGLVVAVFFGWLFLVAGIAGLAFTIRARGAPGFAWSLLSALAALIAGAALLWSPLAGLVTLTYVLTGFFLIDGVLMIFLSLAHKHGASARWMGMLLNGVVDLFLAGVIIAGLPGTLLWAFGLIVGIDMIFGGATLAALAFSTRKAKGV